MRMKEGLHLLNHFLPEPACVIVCSTAPCAFRYVTGGTRVSARGAFRVCPETQVTSVRGRSAAGGGLSLDGRQRSPHGSRINTGRTSTVAPNLLWSRSDRLIGTFRTVGWALSQAQSDDGGVSVSRECLERYFRGKSIRCDCRSGPPRSTRAGAA